MEELCCDVVTCQRMRSLTQSLKNMLTNVAISGSTSLSLMVTIHQLWMLPTSRSCKQSEVVERLEDNSFPSDRADFLNNYTNKQSFVNQLAKVLQENGFEAVLCPGDADNYSQNCT